MSSFADRRISGVATDDGGSSSHRSESLAVGLLRLARRGEAGQKTLELLRAQCLDLKSNRLMGALDRLTAHTMLADLADTLDVFPDLDLIRCLSALMLQEGSLEGVEDEIIAAFPLDLATVFRAIRESHPARDASYVWACSRLVRALAVIPSLVDEATVFCHGKTGWLREQSSDETLDSLRAIISWHLLRLIGHRIRPLVDWSPLVRMTSSSNERTAYFALLAMEMCIEKPIVSSSAQKEDQEELNEIDALFMRVWHQPREDLSTPEFTKSFLKRPLSGFNELVSLSTAVNTIHMMDSALCVSSPLLVEGPEGCGKSLLIDACC